MASKRQVFLVVPALALAYGFGEAEFGEAKAAIPTKVCKSLRTTLSPEQKTGVEAFAIANLRDEAVAEFGAGVIGLEHAKQTGISVKWHDVDTPEETATIASHVCDDGEWTARGAP